MMGVDKKCKKRAERWDMPFVGMCADKETPCFQFGEYPYREHEMVTSAGVPHLVTIYWSKCFKCNNWSRIEIDKHCKLSAQTQYIRASVSCLEDFPPEIKKLIEEEALRK